MLTKKPKKMTTDQRILRVRKVIMPAVEIFEKTITSEQPHGCPQALKKVVKIYDECRSALGNHMPTANKIGYGHIRNKMNEAMSHYGLRHSY